MDASIHWCGCILHMNVDKSTFSYVHFLGLVGAVSYDPVIPVLD